MVNREVNLPIDSDFTILRFLQPCPAFLGVDMRIYGPFQREDVATVPAIQAKNLIRSGHALEIHPGIGPHPRRDAPVLDEMGEARA